MKRQAAFAAVAVLTACGPAVSRIDVTPPSTQLQSAGASAQLQAAVRAPDGKPLPLDVRWASANPEIAQVDARGRVSAVKTGTATVTATAAGVTGQAAVVVSIPVRAAIRPAALELVGLPSGGTLMLSLVDEAGRSFDARQATWASSDPKVVQVSPIGAVSAVGSGRATVTGSTAGLSATAEVTVRLPDFARISINPPRLTLAPGGAGHVQAAAVDGAGAPVAGVPLTLSSSDVKVVEVNGEGHVTALARGKARIIATGGGRSAAIEVIVRK